MKLLNKSINAIKLIKNRISWFVKKRIKELTIDSDKDINMEETKTEQPKEEKVEVKEDDKIKQLEAQIAELLNYKVATEREKLLKSEKIDGKAVDYLTILLDNLEGDDDKKKLTKIKQDIPQLFNQKTEYNNNKSEPVKNTKKQYEIKVEKLDDNEKEKSNGIKDTFSNLGIGI